MKTISIFVVAILISSVIAPSLLAGTIVAWGSNQYGQCNVPVGNDFIAIAAGGWHSLALKSDGSIVGWGYNQYGQATPPAGNNFTAIAAGWDNSLALKSDGSIVGWGNNDKGKATPPAGNNFVAIAAGNSHSLAIKSDGTLIGWGYNGNGECVSPGGNDFAAIAAGSEYSLALKTDGSLIAWGRDNGGNIAVMPGNDFVAIAASIYHNLVLRSDGSLSAWGACCSNSSGQAFVPSGKNYVAVATSNTQSVALRSDGSLIAWGSNYYGIWNKPAGNNFMAIASCGYHALALTGQLKTVSSEFKGDIDHDGRVDFNDFAILASDWLKDSNAPVSPVSIAKIELNSDPGWTTEGQWQFGTPMGMGGSSHGYPDPNAAYTGLNIYGVNLSGDYTVAVGGPYTLTTGPFDCNSYAIVELSFARWLNTDTADYVQCKVEASNDGSTWQTVWVNPTSVPITDNQWQVVQYNISQIAAGYSQVYLRWSYQILDDRAFPYSGWNIDDVELRGLPN